VTDPVMTLWTTWVDYGATGEGRTLLARIAYAENQQSALDGFAKQFGEFHAGGAEAAQGVLENGVTKVLFAAEMLERARQLEGRANLDLYAEFHFNFA
jgi:hypothetical protein